MELLQMIARNLGMERLVNRHGVDEERRQPCMGKHSRRQLQLKACVLELVNQQ
jgi:hypothetical protein